MSSSQVSMDMDMDMEIHLLDVSGASSKKTTILFIDDDDFVEEANSRLSEQTQEGALLLQQRVDFLLRDQSNALPGAENVQKTLKVLQQRFGLVIDECNKTLSALIADVMNRTRQTAFGFKDAAADDFISLTPSTLLMRRLAHLLQVKIVVVSTRASTLVIEPFLAPIVALVHVADSFEHMRTYCPLVVSNVAPQVIQSLLPSVSTPSILAPETSAPSVSPLSVFVSPVVAPVTALSAGLPSTQGTPLAKYCPGARHQTYRKDKIGFDLEDAERCFLGKCTWHLRKVVKGGVEVAVKKIDDRKTSKRKKKVDDADIMEASRASLLEKESTRTRLPQNVLQDAIRDLEQNLKRPQGSISVKDFVDKLDDRQLEIFKVFVNDNFEMFWRDAVEKKEKWSANEVEPRMKEDDLDKETLIRVCDLPIKRILRKEFDADAKETIIDLLGESQTLLSDHMEEVQAACMKAHVEVFRGCLSDDWEDVDITGILPAGFQIRDPKLQKDPVVRVAKVSHDLLKKITKSEDKNADVVPDLRDLFSQNFLGFLAKKLLPPDRDSEPAEKKRKTEKENNHADWITLVECIQRTASDDDNFRENAECPAGLSQTLNTLLRTAATDIANIWNGNIYGDIKRAVVRYLVRIHLRPLGEERYRQNKKKWAEKKMHTSTQSQGSTDDVDHQEVMLDDDGDYDDEEMDEDDGFREALEEEAKEEEVKGELMRKAEPTSKHLRGLETVICKLLDIGELSGLVTKDIVRQHLFDSHTFKENEVDAAVIIINALRPFTPKPTSGTIPRHVLATGPFAYLANHLLHAMGFGDFTRKLYPISSAGKLHPLPLGSTGIREALCSSKKEHFDVFDAEGTLCSTQALGVKNAPVIFSAFFDMSVIHSICQKYGLVFADRLLFVDKNTVRIMGHGIRKDAPKDLFKEKRLKTKKSKKQREPSYSQLRQQELEKEGMTKPQAKKIADDLTDTIKVKEKALQGRNRKAANLEKQLKTLKSNFQDARVSVTDQFKTNMQKMRNDFHDVQREILRMRAEIKDLRQKKYDHNKYYSSTTSSSSSASSAPASSPASSSSAVPAGSSSSAPVNLSSSVPAGPFSSNPTIRRLGCLDKAESINIKGLVAEIEDNNLDPTKRQMVLMPGGTDPGAHVLFNTVPVPESTLISMKNRFDVLAGIEPEPPDYVPATLQQMRFPAAHQTKVSNIRHHGGLTRQSQVRSKMVTETTIPGMAGPETIYEVYTKLADTSITRASTSHAIEEAQELRRRVRKDLRKFENSKKMQSLRHYKELRLRRAYDRIAAKERKAFSRQANITADASLLPSSLQSPLIPSLLITAPPRLQTNGFCLKCGIHHRPEPTLDRTSPERPRMSLQHLEACPKSRPVVIPLMLHGDAGLGVGSRLKGHSKMGGNKVPERHMRYTPVAKTPEHKSSQTCPFCFQLVRLARARRKKDGEMRLVRVHGAIECTNPDCESYKVGYTQRGRDTNAAVNIALAGYVLVTSDPEDRATLPPFDPKRPTWSLSSNTRSTSTGEPSQSSCTEAGAMQELSLSSNYAQ
ncbi:hypothetical protein EMPS_07617 [Entomortierella parvispora]|uniref:Uncharacterized protein n=1 Tax=Entomortierella parvispora TaxID=205924 RepID=A0A9P3HEI9_9FUNG|nr:hypothetical protein EMPS_07617 [Entomortierella parvispora]